jgi:hypothetical protein
VAPPVLTSVPVDYQKEAPVESTAFPRRCPEHIVNISDCYKDGMEARLAEEIDDPGTSVGFV